jgi:hypothetical protein
MSSGAPFISGTAPAQHHALLVLGGQDGVKHRREAQPQSCITDHGLGVEISRHRSSSRAAIRDIGLGRWRNGGVINIVCASTTLGE